MKKINASKMDIGDYGLYDGDIVRLTNNGKAGGCETELYLAYVCTIDDEYDGKQGNPCSKNLPEIIIDTDEVSA